MDGNQFEPVKQSLFLALQIENRAIINVAPPPPEVIPMSYVVPVRRYSVQLNFLDRRNFIEYFMFDFTIVLVILVLLRRIFDNQTLFNF